MSSHVEIYESIDRNTTIMIRLGEIVEKYGNVFKLQDGKIVCSYCTTQFNPLPPRGDVLVNVQSQAQTSSHLKAVGSRKKQTSLSSFFTGGQKSYDYMVLVRSEYFQPKRILLYAMECMNILYNMVHPRMM